MVSIGAMIRHGANQYNRFQTLIEVQRESLLAMKRLSGEIVKTTREGVEFFNAPPIDPQGVVFAVSTEQDGYGRPSWTEFVCYYVDPQTRRLLRKVRPVNPPRSSPIPRPSAELARTGLIAANDAYEPQVIARHVESLLGEVKVGVIELELTVRVYRYEGSNQFDENVLRSSFEVR